MTYAPDTVARPEEWTANAVCAQQPYAGGDLWYADKWDKDTRRTAINLCRACPVIDLCRAATARDEAGKGLKHRYGIRAAMTPRQRWLAEQKAREQDEPRPACGTTKAYEQQLTPSRSVVCGTRGGYQKHRRDGEPACDACRQANADADRRLRNTGTTKATTPERSAV